MVFSLPLPSLDTLLSLPLLSFFVLPSALSTFSWTTSLNILFFYLAWATVVFSHSPLNIEFFSTLTVRVLFNIIPCLIFTLFDLLIPSLSTSVKQHGTKARPFTALGVRGTNATTTKLLSYLTICIFNILLSITLQVLIEYTFTNIFQTRSLLRITASLPMPLSIGKDLTRGYLLRGPLAYYIHKHILHNPHSSLFRSLTNWHLKWNHTLTTTLPFSSSYDHPIIYLLYRWVPVYLPAIIFRFHLLTYLLFVSLISLEEVFAWSGYSVLPSTIMLAGMARRMEMHLMSGGKGNYGPWGVMDWVHGTSLGDTDVLDDVHEEMKKRDVKGKTKRAARNAKAAADGATDDLIDGVIAQHTDEEDEGEGDGNSSEGVMAAGRRKASRVMRRRK